MTRETAEKIIATTTEGDCLSGTEYALVLIVRELKAENQTLQEQVAAMIKAVDKQVEFNTQVLGYLKAVSARMFLR